jgi:hypothetical protein
MCETYCSSASASYDGNGDPHETPSIRVTEERALFMSDAYEPTKRTAVNRLLARGAHDRAVAHQIVDEALIRHLGFVVAGRPFVIPGPKRA